MWRKTWKKKKEGEIERGEGLKIHRMVLKGRERNTGKDSEWVGDKIKWRERRAEREELKIKEEEKYNTREKQNYV